MTERVNPEQWQRLQPLLDRILDEPPERRAALLDHLCGPEEADLRVLLEELVEGEDERGEIFEEGVERYNFLLDPEAGEPETPVGVTRIGQRIGHFSIAGEIARGGMGSVYLAERTGGLFEQRVALKMIRLGLDDSITRSRFDRERRILAKLEHPNIARLIDGGITPEGAPYFAMEYVEGKPIVQYCDDHVLSVPARLHLFLAACEAVQYSHANFVVHGDLKPSNILVTADGRVKLLDFGIAKLVSADGPLEGATLARSRPLTPEYAAPEQILGGTMTTATDVYSLGVVLYELLCGHSPYRFEKRTRAEVERVVCERLPERPSSRLSALGTADHPDGSRKQTSAATIAASRGSSTATLGRLLAGDLDNIVLRAIEKEPHRRYRSAEALSEDVQRHLEGHPVRARQPSRRYRAQKFVSRHRYGVATASIVTLTVLGGLVGTTWQARRATREAARTEQVRDFLVSVFEGADPDESDGEEVTAVELLDRGAQRVRTELADEPELQAEMLLLMADVYESLGESRVGLPLVREALALRRELHGETHPAVAEAMNEEAWLQYLEGDYDAAERGLRTVVALRRRLLGPRHVDLARSIDNLSETLRMKGQFAEAEPLAREALAMRRDLLGEHPDIATSLNNLAVIVRQTGARSEAEALVREALALDIELRGPDDRNTLIDLSNLASILREQGEFDEAERILRDLVDRQTARYGQDHPLTITTTNNLASVLATRGAPAEAEPLYRRVLAWWRGNNGLEHPNAMATQISLSQSLQRQGKYVEAESLLREVVGVARRVLGDAHPNTLVALNNLAATFVARGAPDQAEPLYGELMANARGVWPEGHPAIATFALGFARLLADDERCAGAMPLLAEATESFTEGGELVPGALGEARLLSGSCLIELGRPAEAEPQLLEAYRAFSGRPDRQLAAAELLVDAYGILGRADAEAEFDAIVASLRAEGTSRD